MHFLLFYTYVPDVLERRAQFRGAHLKHAWAAQERGELVLAGALADPVDGGVLWFSAPDKVGGRAIRGRRPVREEWAGHAVVGARMDHRGR